MFDGTLARRYAGYSFRRADTVRDERAELRSHAVEDFLRGLCSVFQRRSISRRRADAFGGRVRAVMAPKESLSDQDLRAALTDEAVRLRASPLDEAALAAVFASLGEACRRIFGYYPHNVQFIGARTLLSGELAEMQTGEGKTLVAALAATAMAASGVSVHVVSTNDYLAKRDAEEMQRLFGFFGLNSGSIQEGMEPEDRREQYGRNICYVSGKELVFDYLKDRLAGHGYQCARVSYTRDLLASASDSASQPLIACLHFVIVDEADSVLIDEARTPLIISREAEGLYEAELIRWAVEQARGMREGVHYTLSAERAVVLRETALAACGPLPATVRPVWQTARWKTVLLRQAISAVYLFSLDQHYIVADGKVQIVDESTGRVMPDRTWEQGLHQLIECKEGLELSGNRETMAKMTFQRFFRRYYLLAGLTGTASEARRELWSVYGLRVRRIPSNKKNRRERLPDICTRNAEAKWERVCLDTQAALERGQPVLVGTRSVEASEAVSAALAARGIAHIVLNARQDKDEAEIVRGAGQPGRVTVATNMAGRGTDIKLGDVARQAGGLHCILTEFHESPRVDRQLFGRSGRQGDPGSVRAIVAATDALFERQAVLAASLLRRAGSDALRCRLLPWVSRWAQWRAERQALRARRQTLKQDKTLHRLIGFAGKTL
ncbi:DEAD/DEAH box helicase [Niveibacterium terrae]|uniref:preprotein translocase subunit SecA n=1 Tax=Niveibacterium terrae TaxID=3373598 RepID=UPI003A8D1A47